MKIMTEEGPPVEEATDLCNEQLAHLPYYFPISYDDFVRGSATTDDDLSNRTMLVARASGRLVGFADLSDHSGFRTSGRGSGVIRFLLYRRGERRVGQALLEAAEKHFRDRQLDGVHAGVYTYRFQRLGPESLSGKLVHVCSPYGLNGYEEWGRWLFMALEHPPITSDELEERSLALVDESV